MPIAYCIDRGNALEHPLPPCHTSEAELVVQKSNAETYARRSQWDSPVVCGRRYLLELLSAKYPEVRSAFDLTYNPPGTAHEAS
jgi:hypothetical protein